MGALTCSLHDRPSERGRPKTTFGYLAHFGPILGKLGHFARLVMTDECMQNLCEADFVQQFSISDRKGGVWHTEQEFLGHHSFPRKRLC